MFGTEDVILSCNMFWHVFFENNYFLFGGKKPIFVANLLVLGEIIIYFSYSVAKILISGRGY